jgi:hypothetical protein
MAPNVLRAATAFGGSMCFDNRAGIGRYGVGMKGAALSMGRALDIISWQERGAFYDMTLDITEVGEDRSNVVLPYRTRRAVWNRRLDSTPSAMRAQPIRAASAGRAPGSVTRACATPPSARASGRASAHPA